MLSVEKVREILEDENILDEEVLEIRDNLYGLAEIAIKSYVKEKVKYENKERKMGVLQFYIAFCFF